MVALYFEWEFLQKFEERTDKMDPIVYDFYYHFLRKIRGVEVYINVASIEELQKLITTNEVYSLISEISSPIILNFKERLQDKHFYREGSISKLFFIESKDEESLQNGCNFYFISNATLKNKWELFLSNRDDSELMIKSNPSPDEIGVFRSWTDLNLFKHKTRNILVFDLYVLANKTGQRISDNLLPCISQLIKNTNGGPDELTIITNDLNQNKKNYWFQKDIDQLSVHLTPLQKRIGNINYIKYDKTKVSRIDPEHNRCIVTNYFYIRFPAGLNVFKENKEVNHRDEIRFDSILKNRTRIFVKELLSNLKQYTSSLKQIDTGVDDSAQSIKHYYYYPNSKSRFLN